MKNDISIKTFWFKLPKIARKVLLIGVIFLIAVGILFLIVQIQHPSCCEASTHLENATKINSNGIGAFKGPIGSFAYPWLLSVLLLANQGINLPIILLVFLMQMSIYFIAVLGITYLTIKSSKKLSETIYLALCANIFVIPYLGVTLPDSLYTSISILLITWITGTEHIQKLNIKWVFLAAFLLSLAITLHPAAIWLVIPVSYGWAQLLWKKRLGVLSFILALLLGALPLYIQIILNSGNIKIIGLFNMTNLGAEAIKLGIENIKSANWVGGGATKIFYPSTNLINLLSGEHNLFWYFNNPIDSVKLLIFKLIGAFDFDYLLPYPHHRPLFEWIPSFFSFTILWAGIFGVLFHLFTNKLTLLGSRFSPIIIFFSWCMVSLLPPIELPITLPLICYFLVVGCTTVDFIMVKTNRTYLWLMVAGWIIFMPIFFWMANFIRLQIQS